MSPLKKEPKTPWQRRARKNSRLIIVHLTTREHYTCAGLRASKVCASGEWKKKKSSTSETVTRTESCGACESWRANKRLEKTTLTTWRCISLIPVSYRRTCTLTDVYVEHLNDKILSLTSSRFWWAWFHRWPTVARDAPHKAKGLKYQTGDTETFRRLITSIPKDIFICSRIYISLDQKDVLYSHREFCEGSKWNAWKTI